MEAARPRASVFVATSLDGCIARSDGGIDWLSRVELEGEDYGFAAFFETIDVLVMGRATYETALGFEAWPYEGKRVVVLTKRPLEPRHGEEPYAGEPGALVARLASEGARRLYVDGGAVIRSFLAADLLDDLTISIVPIVLGDGIRLFEGGVPERPLALEDARVFSTGLVQLRYRVERG